MPDRIMTFEEYQTFLNGITGTGLAIKRGYYPATNPLTVILSTTAEALALALNMHPRTVLEIAARQANYSGSEWEKRKRTLEAFSADATEKMREDLIGAVLDWQKLVDEEDEDDHIQDS